VYVLRILVKFVDLWSYSLFSDLVDLGLEVADYLWGHMVAEDLKQVDGLRSGYRLVRNQLHSFLDLLDLSILWYEMCILGLPNGFVREYRSFFRSLRHCQAHRSHRARAQHHKIHTWIHSSEKNKNLVTYKRLINTIIIHFMSVGGYLLLSMI